MNIRGVQRARIIARKVRQKISPGGVILLYHRVAEVDVDPQMLAVSPDNFHTHLEILRKMSRSISMAELSRCLSEKIIPRRAVAITFDDGYRDNLEQAKPLLSRYDVPATIFAASGYLGSNREFWWDELERLFLKPGTLPEQLKLEVNGRDLVFSLGTDSSYSKNDAVRHTGWNVEQTIRPTKRHHVYDALCPLLREMTVPAREQILATLRAWAGDDGVGRSSHLAMTREQVKELGRGGLCEVGAHTVNHPRLSSLSSLEQQAEVRDSKMELEAMLGRSVTSFSYPFGNHADYTSETINSVRGSGFAWACSNFPAVVWRGTDPFQMPRVLVRNWDAATFTRFIREWL